MLEMNGLQINAVAAVVATFANVFIGFLWYAKLFGPQKWVTTRT